MRRYEVSINNKDYAVVVKRFKLDGAELEINGKPYSVNFDETIKSIPTSMPTAHFMPPVPPPMQPVTIPPSVAPVAEPAAPSSAPSFVSSPAAAKKSEGKNSVLAPIPGAVMEIMVKVGDRVKDGQSVVKMEAMKMENIISAAAEGTVKAINVNVGDAVNQGEVLIVLA
ncbi:MAG: acetyl-CoA carboxylase biotin carboxyl carrier protein subunit [Proteobacteria bacterium]|nr:acetyl-CoA carboxylase biotin carboxyl carrier protein subunit [Pseudomonadota bacterium]